MKTFIYAILILFISFSCDVKKSDVSPDYNFMKIYDDADLTNAYYPIDAIETGDGGFLILSAIIDSLNTNFPTVHIMKADQNGNIAWEVNADPAYVNPVPGLMNIGGSIQFVCMDDNSFRTKVMAITDMGNSGSLSETGSSQESYPLAAHYSNAENNIILLSYDGIGTYSVITAYNSNMNSTFRISTSTNKDFSYEIFQHLKKQRTPFPFFITEFQSDGNTLFGINAFSNYTLSLLFIDHNAGNITGRLNGYQESGGTSAAIQLEAEVFAVATSRFNSGDISLSPGISIDFRSTHNVSELGTVLFPELKVEAPVKLLRDEFNSRELVVYAATTKTDQIVLYFFDEETQELVRSKYLGHTNPVEISSLLRTSDGGLVIAGKTWVAGRYQRIILYKLALEELGL